jgi:hypothetical protein
VGKSIFRGDGLWRGVEIATMACVPSRAKLCENNQSSVSLTIPLLFSALCTTATAEFSVAFRTLLLFRSVYSDYGYGVWMLHALSREFTLNVTTLLSKILHMCVTVTIWGPKPGLICQSRFTLSLSLLTSLP